MKQKGQNLGETLHCRGSRDFAERPSVLRREVLHDRTERVRNVSGVAADHEMILGRVVERVRVACSIFNHVGNILSAEMQRRPEGTRR